MAGYWAALAALGRLGRPQVFRTTNWATLEAGSAVTVFVRAAPYFDLIDGSKFFPMSCLPPPPPAPQSRLQRGGGPGVPDKFRTCGFSARLGARVPVPMPINVKCTLEAKPFQCGVPVVHTLWNYGTQHMVRVIKRVHARNMAKSFASSQSASSNCKGVHITNIRVEIVVRLRSTYCSVGIPETAWGSGNREIRGNPISFQGHIPSRHIPFACNPYETGA